MDQGKSADRASETRDPEPEHGEIRETLTSSLPLELLWPLAMAYVAREGLPLKTAVEHAADELLELMSAPWEKRDGKREYPDEDLPGHWTPLAHFELQQGVMKVVKTRRWSSD